MHFNTHQNKKEKRKKKQAEDGTLDEWIEQHAVHEWKGKYMS